MFYILVLFSAYLMHSNSKTIATTMMMMAKLLQLPVAAAAMISDIGRKRCRGHEEVPFSARCSDNKPQTDVKGF
jgi:hypothetical protein